MEQVILIHNGTTDPGLNLIRKLLSENDLIKNLIKNRVFCVDKPENLYKAQEFLGFDEFTFLANSQEAPLDINMYIDKIFICTDKGEKSDLSKQWSDI